MHFLQVKFVRNINRSSLVVLSASWLMVLLVSCESTVIDKGQKSNDWKKSVEVALDTATTRETKPMAAALLTQSQELDNEWKKIARACKTIDDNQALFIKQLLIECKRLEQETKAYNKLANASKKVTPAVNPAPPVDELKLSRFKDRLLSDIYTKSPPYMPHFFNDTVDISRCFRGKKGQEIGSEMITIKDFALERNLKDEVKEKYKDLIEWSTKPVNKKELILLRDKFLKDLLLFPIDSENDDEKVKAFWADPYRNTLLMKELYQKLKLPPTEILSEKKYRHKLYTWLFNMVKNNQFNKTESFLEILSKWKTEESYPSDFNTFYGLLNGDDQKVIAETKFPWEDDKNKTTSAFMAKLLNNIDFIEAEGDEQYKEFAKAYKQSGSGYCKEKVYDYLLDDKQYGNDFKDYLYYVLLKNDDFRKVSYIAKLNKTDQAKMDLRSRLFGNMITKDKPVRLVERQDVINRMGLRRLIDDATPFGTSYYAINFSNDEKANRQAVTRYIQVLTRLISAQNKYHAITLDDIHWDKLGEAAGMAAKGVETIKDMGGEK